MTRLLLDTDVALGVQREGRPRDIDDGFAIVEAINSPDIDLIGVTCVFGNGLIDQVEAVAKDIVRLKEVDVPVVRGAGEGMRRDSPTNAAVEFLADQLRKQRATVAAIGPLTNIGLLVQHHPDVLLQIDELLIVAGRSGGAEFFIGDAGPVGDLNFEQDVLSARIVMDSEIPCVLMGFELTSQVVVTRDDLEVIRNRDSPTAQYFYDNSLAWCDYWTKQFPTDAGFHPWDSAAIAWILDRELFTTEKRGHRISDDPPRLDCHRAYSGRKHLYCHGFRPGGARSFVNRVICEVY